MYIVGNCIQKKHLNEEILLVNVSTDEKENNHNFYAKKFAYLGLWRKAAFIWLTYPYFQFQLGIVFMYIG